MPGLLITPDIRYHAQLLDVDGRVNIPDDMEVLYGVLQCSEHTDFSVSFIQYTSGNHIQLSLVG